MKLKLKLMLGGAKSYLPWLSDFTGTGGSVSPRYCYSVWLRHLALVHRHGLPAWPETLVELGPGDSVGVGLAALLTGTERYRALDVVRHASVERDLAMLDELAPLVRERAPIPGDEEFPLLHPRIAARAFPAELLTEERLQGALAPVRLEQLRDALRRSADETGPAAPIRYVCPWDDPAIVEPASADMVLSQVVLQDVDDLPAVFAAMHRWLKPGGVMSHQIDFRAADRTDGWNAHWTYSNLEWRIVRGNRPYYLNRAPLPTYLTHFRESGFEVVAVTTTTDTASVPRDRLAPRFRGLSDEELITSSAHVLAIKR